MGRTQFGEKAERKTAFGKDAPGKTAVWEGQAFGKGIAQPKGGEGGVGRQERRQASRVAASSTDETAADSSEQQVVSSKQQAVSSKH